MSLTSKDEFSDFDEDADYLRLLASLNSNREIMDLKRFDIAPVDPMDAFLKSLQQSVLAVEKVNGILQEQNRALFKWVARLKKENEEIKKELDGRRNRKK